MVEQEAALKPAEPGVPPEKSDPTGREVIGEIVLGEVDLIVGRDHLDLRFAPDAAVIQPLAWVSARAGAPAGRRRQPDEFSNNPGRAGGATHVSDPPCSRWLGRRYSSTWRYRPCRRLYRPDATPDRPVADSRTGSASRRSRRRSAAGRRLRSSRRPGHVAPSR